MSYYDCSSIKLYTWVQSEIPLLVQQVVISELDYFKILEKLCEHRPLAIVFTVF